MKSTGPADRNVILTGFMGTGKTTVGLALAQRLGWEFVDTDQIIEARHGTIAEIFADRGEQGFRDIERALAAELSERRGLVVSTGGRLMLDPANQESLGSTGPVFCLTASAGAILDRVLSDPSATERPLLAGDDPAGRIAALLEERAPLYGRFTQIETEGRTPDEIADLVARALAPA